MKIKTRKMIDEDIPFIGATFINCMWNNSPMSSMKVGDKFIKLLPKNRLTNELQKFFNSNLPYFDSLIAVNAEDENQILGYMLYIGEILYFSYVKLPFRKLGIYKFMHTKAFGEKETQCAFMTYDYARLLKKFRASYNPFVKG